MSVKNLSGFIGPLYHLGLLKVVLSYYDTFLICFKLPWILFVLPRVVLILPDLPRFEGERTAEPLYTQSWSWPSIHWP